MKIFPRDNLYGEYAVPPDKSITHRAIMLGALAKGKTTIINPFMCQDTQSLLSCVKKLGAKVSVKKSHIEIRGAKRLSAVQKFDCGNSAIALRFLCGVIAGRGGRAVLTGNRQLCRKPLREIKEPLEKMGATVALTDYVSAPVLVESSGVRAIDYDLPHGNSQVKSSILFCALVGSVKAVVHENCPSRNHMEILLKEMGGNVAIKDSGCTIEFCGGDLTGKKIAVGRDFTLAAHYLSLGLMLGKVICHNVNINPTRTALLDILERMGANIVVEEKTPVCGERVADITAYKSKLRATHVGEDEACRIIDELPLLAFLMGVSDGESIISIGCSGKKEIEQSTENVNVFDCLTVTANAINAIGGKCRVFDGGIVVNGVDKYVGGNIQTNGYPLIAMSGAVALTASENGGEIDEETCETDTHKAFFREFEKNAFAIIRRRDESDYIDVLYEKVLNMTGLFTVSCTSLYPSEDNFKKLMSELKNYDGFSILAPYINDVTRRLYTLKGRAKAIKSANVGVGNAGFSTDGEAFLAALKYCGESLVDKRVLVFGCGGLGRSIAYAVLSARARVDVYDKSAKKALDFKKRTKENIYILGELSSDVKYDYVINTVCRDGVDETDSRDMLPLALCGAIIDPVYDGSMSFFKAEAEKRDKKFIGGEPFAFFQAYYAACVFSDKDVSEQKAFSMYEIFKSEAKK